MVGRGLISKTSSKPSFAKNTNRYFMMVFRQRLNIYLRRRATINKMKKVKFVGIESNVPADTMVGPIQTLTSEGYYWIKYFDSFQIG